MCYWKKHRKDTEQKISPIVVWPLIPRKAGREWEQNAALVDTQEHFVSKPVIKNTAQTPQEPTAHGRQTRPLLGMPGWKVACGAAAGEQDRELRHRLELGASHL